MQLICINCIVGALTSKPFAFTGRSWEYDTFIGVDVFNVLAGYIRINVRDNAIFRVMPSRDWCTDLIRFGHDYIKYARLTLALLRVRNPRRFIALSLHDISVHAVEFLDNKRVARLIYDPLVDVVDVLMTKYFFSRWFASVLLGMRYAQPVAPDFRPFLGAGRSGEFFFRF